MNYTENYHLPQWEETDRIMRTDFNAAMASLEGGLTECRDAAAAGSVQASSALYAGLFRLAYNHWHAAAALESFPAQAGVFRQGFARGEGGSAPGAIQMDDCVWLVNGSEALAIKHITPTLNKGDKISTTQGSSGSTNAYFTPPYGGRLTGITVRIHCTEFSGNVIMPCSFEIQAKKRVLGQGSGELNLTQNGYSTMTLPVDMPLHAGERHTLTMRVSNMRFTGTIEIFGLEVTGYQTPSAYATHTLQSENSSLSGLALVHYETCGTGSTLSLQWDGETLAPQKTRSFIQSGRTVQEAEFRLNRPVSAASSLRLSITCGSGGDIALYDWGAILI